MKKILIICAFVVGFISAQAQTVIDSFTVGPYVVDYIGEGDVKYRLRDNINLYEYFELQKDTVIMAPALVQTPVKHGIQLSGYVGANRYASKEFGISGVWKQNIGTNLYFNGGLSLAIDHYNFLHIQKRNMFEVGVPLQIELGRLSHQKAGLYGIVGVAPVFYSTMSLKDWENDKFVDAPEDKKKSGFLIAPSLEFGGNIPVGNIIMRIGVYGNYKINCSKGNYDVYTNYTGHCFIGAKIGVVL